MKIGKRATAALALAALAVLGTSAAANASTGIGGFPILHASTNQGAHQCIVIGSDSQGHEGVMCADIVTYPTPGAGSGSYQAIGQIQAYCQTTVEGIVTGIQCAQVDVSGRFAGAGGWSTPVGAETYCGHQYGPCAVGRNVWQSSWFGWDTTTGCSSNPNSSYDVWTSIMGGTTSGIELPGSDKWVYLGTGNDGLSQSSGHNYICW
jgi:hypothetical protein